MDTFSDPLAGIELFGVYGGAFNFSSGKNISIIVMISFRTGNIKLFTHDVKKIKTEPKVEKYVCKNKQELESIDFTKFFSTVIST
jgi:hypothetical protein